MDSKPAKVNMKELRKAVRKVLAYKPGLAIEKKRPSHRRAKPEVAGGVKSV